jgi:hypothetical protein
MDFVAISKKDKYHCCTSYGVFSSKNEPVQHVNLFLCLSVNQKRNPTSYEFLKYNKTIISVGVFLVLFPSSKDNIAVLYLKNYSNFL